VSRKGCDILPSLQSWESERDDLPSLCSTINHISPSTNSKNNFYITKIKIIEKNKNMRREWGGLAEREEELVCVIEIEEEEEVE